MHKFNVTEMAVAKTRTPGITPTKRLQAANQAKLNLQVAASSVSLCMVAVVLT